MSTNTPNDPRIGTTHSRALCCTCGTVRTWSQKAGLRGHLSRGYSPEEIVDFETRFGGPWRGPKPFHRQLSNMKCATCKQITRHALIKDCVDPELRDRDEIEDQPSTVRSERVDQRMLDNEIARIERFGVKVGYARRQTLPSEGSFYYHLRQFRDQRFQIYLNRDVPAPLLLIAVRKVWREISDPERCERIDWDLCDDPSRPQIARSISYDISDSGFQSYSEHWINEVDRRTRLWVLLEVAE